MYCQYCPHPIPFPHQTSILSLLLLKMKKQQTPSRIQSTFFLEGTHMIMLRQSPSSLPQPKMALREPGKESIGTNTRAKKRIQVHPILNI